jgi:hypothetical protein
MKNRLFAAIALLLALSLAVPALAMEGMGHEGHDMSSGETFVHHAKVDGITAEFQVMSLASMGMTDEEGASHHVMVNFFKNGMKEKLEKVIGKVKLIAPSGEEQVATLKDYGGTYAANFTIDEHGKWGVISLFKVGEEKHVAKFWYPHEMK